MALNGISTLSTKQARQIAKLDLVSLKRQGYTLDDAGNIVDIITPFTTTNVQNVAGTNSEVGFFFLGNWASYPETGFQYIQVGWTVVNNPTWIVTEVNAPNQTVTISGGVFVSGVAYSFTGNIVTLGTANTAAKFYRAKHTYDITRLPTQYSGNLVVNNPNVGGLAASRPWI